MIAGFAFILPISVFAQQDQGQDENKHGKKEGKSQHEGKAARQKDAVVTTQSVGKSRGGNAQESSGVYNASSGKRHGNDSSNGSANVERSSYRGTASQNVQPANSQVNQVYSKRGQHQVYSNQQTNQTQVYSGQQRNQTQVYSNQQYNRGNNYGGLWFAANTHSNWNQNQQYYWNNHNYRWYEGGWLIIDAGYNPYYSNAGYGYGGYGYRSYGYSGSVVVSVQSRLANLGYYRGSIDGDIGPGTRNAIASYQGDNDLRVTGRINDPLLQSLRL